MAAQPAAPESSGARHDRLTRHLLLALEQALNRLSASPLRAADERSDVRHLLPTLNSMNTQRAYMELKNIRNHPQFAQMSTRIVERVLASGKPDVVLDWTADILHIEPWTGIHINGTDSTKPLPTAGGGGRGGRASVTDGGKRRDRGTGAGKKTTARTTTTAANGRASVVAESRVSGRASVVQPRIIRTSDNSDGLLADDDDAVAGSTFLPAVTSFDVDANGAEMEPVIEVSEHSAEAEEDESMQVAAFPPREPRPSQKLTGESEGGAPENNSPAPSPRASTTTTVTITNPSPTRSNLSKAPAGSATKPAAASSNHAAAPRAEESELGDGVSDTEVTTLSRGSTQLAPTDAPTNPSSSPVSRTSSKKLRSVKVRRRMLTEYVEDHKQDFADSAEGRKAQVEAMLTLQTALPARIHAAQQHRQADEARRLDLDKGVPWRSRMFLLRALAATQHAVRMHDIRDDQPPAHPAEFQLLQCCAWTTAGAGASSADPGGDAVVERASELLQARAAAAGGSDKPKSCVLEGVFGLFASFSRAIVLGVRARCWTQTHNAARHMLNALHMLARKLPVSAMAPGASKAFFLAADALIDMLEEMRAEADAAPADMELLVAHMHQSLLLLFLAGRHQRVLELSARFNEATANAHALRFLPLLRQSLALSELSAQATQQLTQVLDETEHAALATGPGASMDSAGQRLSSLRHHLLLRLESGREPGSLVRLYQRTLETIDTGDRIVQARVLLEKGNACLAAGDAAAARGQWSAALGRLGLGDKVKEWRKKMDPERAAAASVGHPAGSPSDPAGHGGYLQAATPPHPRVLVRLGPRGALVALAAAVRLAHLGGDEALDDKTEWALCATALARWVLAFSMPNAWDPGFYLEARPYLLAPLRPLTAMFAAEDVPALAASLQFVGQHLVAGGHGRSALPVLALLDHLAFDVCRNRSLAVATALTRLRAMLQLGLLDKALALFFDLGLGLNLPDVGGACAGLSGGRDGTGSGGAGTAGGSGGGQGTTTAANTPAAGGSAGLVGAASGPPPLLVKDALPSDARNAMVVEALLGYKIDKSHESLLGKTACLQLELLRGQLLSALAASIPVLMEEAQFRSGWQTPRTGRANRLGGGGGSTRELRVGGASGSSGGSSDPRSSPRSRQRSRAGAAGQARVLTAQQLQTKLRARLVQGATDALTAALADVRTRYSEAWVAAGQARESVHGLLLLAEGTRALASLHELCDRHEEALALSGGLLRTMQCMFGGSKSSRAAGADADTGTGTGTDAGEQQDDGSGPARPPPPPPAQPLWGNHLAQEGVSGMALWLALRREFAERLLGTGRPELCLRECNEALAEAELCRGSVAGTALELLRVGAMEAIGLDHNLLREALAAMRSRCEGWPGHVPVAVQTMLYQRLGDLAAAGGEPAVSLSWLRKSQQLLEAEVVATHGWASIQQWFDGPHLSVYVAQAAQLVAVQLALAEKLLDLDSRSRAAAGEAMALLGTAYGILGSSGQQRGWAASRALILMAMVVQEHGLDVCEQLTTPLRLRPWSGLEDAGLSEVVAPSILQSLSSGEGGAADGTEGGAAAGTESARSSDGAVGGGDRRAAQRVTALLHLGLLGVRNSDSDWVLMQRSYLALARALQGLGLPVQAMQALLSALRVRRALEMVLSVHTAPLEGVTLSIAAKNEWPPAALVPSDRLGALEEQMALACEDVRSEGVDGTLPTTLAVEEAKTPVALLKRLRGLEVQRQRQHWRDAGLLTAYAHCHGFLLRTCPEYKEAFVAPVPPDLADISPLGPPLAAWGLCVLWDGDELVYAFNAGDREVTPGARSGSAATSSGSAGRRKASTSAGSPSTSRKNSTALDTYTPLAERFAGQVRTGRLAFGGETAAAALRAAAAALQALAATGAEQEAAALSRASDLLEAALAAAGQPPTGGADVPSLAQAVAAAKKLDLGLVARVFDPASRDGLCAASKEVCAWLAARLH